MYESLFEAGLMHSNCKDILLLLQPTVRNSCNILEKKEKKNRKKANA